MNAEVRVGPPTVSAPRTARFRKALKSREPIIRRVWRNHLESTWHSRLAPMSVWQMSQLNAHSHQSVTGSAPVIVSLTTYGSRIDTVHLTIESIARGTAKPARLILWLDEQERLATPTPELARLVARGLEIRSTENWRSHKKYFPALDVIADHPGFRLVTADDDVLYPRDWLAKLVRVAKKHPNDVVCHRAHRIRMVGTRIAPYSSWGKCVSRRASLLHFATGVSGVSYPVAVLDKLRELGTGFLSVAPSADDVWLHATALSVAVRTRQVRAVPRHFPTIPATNSTGLSGVHIGEGGNDKQIAATYSQSSLNKLAICAQTDRTRP